MRAILATLAMAGTVAFVGVAVTIPDSLAQEKSEPSTLVVRVALFSADQDRPDLYRDFIDGHLFPTLRRVPGYVGTFIARDPKTGQSVSLGFFRSEADVAAGEEAVGRAIRELPPGSVPRASSVARCVVVFRDLSGEFSK
jgi:hypothetical protein